MKFIIQVTTVFHAGKMMKTINGYKSLKRERGESTINKRNVI